MNSSISGYSVNSILFSATPLGTALAEFQYRPSAEISAAKKSKHSGIVPRHNVGIRFACHYAMRTTNITYSTSGSISYGISQVNRQHFPKSISAKEMNNINYGIKRTVPAGKFY